MIVCGRELIDCGFDEYWDDINKFARNQLVENQVKYTGYVVCDNTKPDAEGITYRDIDKRMIGGFTGGSEPNSISLTRFRSIAGCCVGTAPVALKTVWDSAITEEDGAFIVNIPFNRETETLSMRSFIPNEGRVVLTAKKDCLAGFRMYDWIVSPSFFIDGKKNEPAECGKIVSFELKEGEELSLEFDVSTREEKETVRETEFTVFWRGCDVIDLLPRGEHVRLYQRDSEKEKFLPLPEDVEYTGAANYGPTQQSKR